jgi:hypothetical protein
MNHFFDMRCKLVLVCTGHSRLHAMYAAVLNLTCRDLAQNQVAEEWIQMVVDPVLVAGDIDLASLTLGNGLEFIYEAFGCFPEGFFPPSARRPDIFP